jgi:hypothetical protein
MSIREALDRTLLLMRDDLLESTPDERLIAALTETTVTIVADAKNIASHSAQSAFVTTTLLLARSGHRVYLAAPSTLLVGPQPPLATGKMLEQLLIVGRDLLPGVAIELGAPKRPDLTILLGDTPWVGDPDRAFRIRGTAWEARLTPVEIGREWPDEDWPIGGMAAAALAAAEVFKFSMRRLSRWSRNPQSFAEQYAPTPQVMINLSPFTRAKVSELNEVDFISGGAITNCALYALLRLPNVKGSARIIEDDTTALSNLNRGMLFVRSRLEIPKAVELSRYATDGFSIRPVIARYASGTVTKIGPLANAVFVGVDDIPPRWDVQRAWPKWLGIGATTHFSAMASYHTPYLACAGCLHPVDDPTRGPIPTVAFVSFWAGLSLTSLYLRHLANDRGLAQDQEFYFSPLRPETFWHTPIQRRSDCPVSCSGTISHRAS